MDEPSTSTGKRSLQVFDSDGFKRPKLNLTVKNAGNTDTTSLALKTFATMEESSSDPSNRSRRHRVNFESLDAYTRHKLLVNYYVLTNPGKVQETFSRDRSNDKNDFTVLLENHRFIWSEDDLSSATLTWGQRVAKKYYDKLFKEYCIIDLSRYTENKFGMRWRSEPEVVDGKGQFSCGAKRCPVRGGLTSWEVLFSYVEVGEKKSALIKVRLCPECSDKLNYHHLHQKAKLKKRKSKKKSKKEHPPKDKAESTEPSSSTKMIINPSFRIKEEILTDTEGDQDGSHKSGPTSDDTNYQDLIDQIWKQPVKLEPEETEATLEEEVDDYLNQLFL